MSDPIVTLTTDFGVASPYAAVMKGVVLSINPRARLVDLTHQIPPQDIPHTAFFLASAVPYFPPGTIHLVVVDPGVGTDRALLCIEVGGHIILAPDNGCWTSLEKNLGAPLVHRITEPRFRRNSVSATFHGRDILAPAAAHLSLGVRPEQLGSVVSTWVRLETPEPRPGCNQIAGEILFVDEFGNLITNIPADRLRQPPDIILVGKQTLRHGFRWVRTYGEAATGSLVALIGSMDRLEIAVVHGSAATRLTAGVGTSVIIGWEQ